MSKKLIFAEVDAKACKDERRGFMCEGCTCWKSTLIND